LGLEVTSAGEEREDARIVLGQIRGRERNRHQHKDKILKTHAVRASFIAAFLSLPSSAKIAGFEQESRSLTE
jgi:hypothetical protein